MAEPEPELDELRAVARRAGISPSDPVEDLSEPPADLWDRIAAESERSPTGEPPSEAPAELSSVPRPRWLVPVAAAAAAAMIVLGVAVLAGDDDAEVVATAALEPLGPSGSGSAELLDEGGTLRLHVDTAGLDPGDGFLEVWVIDPNVEQLISLGPLRADGLYDLPPGLDPQAFPIVDVSVEPIDGNPTHSGDSVLRGQLEF